MTCPATNRRLTGYAVARGVVLASIFALGISAPAAARLQEPAGPAIDYCELRAQRRVQPDSIALGGEIEVTLEAEISCPNHSPDRQYVLAVSAWPSATEADAVRAALRIFVSQVDLTRSSVGLVLGHTPTPTTLPPTKDRAELELAIDGYGPSAAGTDTATLLGRARRLLMAGDVPTGRRHIVLVSRERARPGSPANLTNELLQIRQTFAYWLTRLCLGGGCDSWDRAENLAPLDQAALESQLTELATRPARLQLDQIQMRDELAGKAQYVFASASPDPTRMGETVEIDGEPVEGRGFIEWTVDGEADRFTARYRLRPTAVGQTQTHSRLVGFFVDTLGRWTPFEEPGASIDVQPAVPRPSQCTMRAAAVAEPGPVVLAATVPVTLTLQAECPDESQETDVVLLIDRSLSTAGEPLEQFRRAARDFIERLDLGLARMAVISYSDEPTVRQDLTQDRQLLMAALEGITSGGNTNTRDAVHRARQLLAARRDGAVTLIAMLYDGHMNVDPTPAVEWARMEGIRFAPVCLTAGASCEGNGLATPPEFAVSATDSGELSTYWGLLTASLIDKGLDSLVISHIPNGAFEYTSPAPGTRPPDLLGDGTLQWQREGLLANSLELGYHLRARGVGRWPIARRIEVVWHDQKGGTGSGSVPVPVLEVEVPAHQGPCTPLVAERDVAPEVVDVAEPFTVTTRLDISCPPADMPLHVAFVIDHSRSMDFFERLENARQAVSAFLDEITSSKWQFALVAFNDTVTHAVALTEDRDAIRDMLNQLEPEGETNISAAIDKAHELLLADQPGVPKAMIVLTDGRNNAGFDPVAEAAARAKAAGIVIIAVCAGGNCDPQLPTAAANPGFYFDVPNAADLTALFQHLAGQLVRSLEGLRIDDLIGPDLELAPATPSPPPDEILPGEIKWWLDVLPVGGVTVTHQLVGLAPGTHPVSLNARVDYYTRAAPGMGVLFLPVPVIKVRGSVTPEVPLPTLPPPVTPSPTPTPTATRHRDWLGPVYLPLAARNAGPER